jgi:hypothetical protein
MRSREPATDLYSGLHKSSWYPRILLKIRFNIILPYKRLFFKWFLPSRFGNQNFLCIYFLGVM